MIDICFNFKYFSLELHIGKNVNTELEEFPTKSYKPMLEDDPICKEDNNLIDDPYDGLTKEEYEQYLSVVNGSNDYSNPLPHEVNKDSSDDFIEKMNKEFDNEDEINISIDRNKEKFEHDLKNINGDLPRFINDDNMGELEYIGDGHYVLVDANADNDKGSKIQFETKKPFKQTKELFDGTELISYPEDEAIESSFPPVEFEPQTDDEYNMSEQTDEY